MKGEQVKVVRSYPALAEGYVDALEIKDEDRERVLELLLGYEEYRHGELSMRTRAGLARARAYGFRGGRPRLVSDEAIQLARRLRGEGLTLQAIGEHLAQIGAEAPGGGSWWPSGIARILGYEEQQRA